MSIRCSNPRCGYADQSAVGLVACPVCGSALKRPGRPPLKLVDGTLGSEFWLEHDTALGRSPDGLDLSDLPYSQVISRFHAFIRWDAERCAYTVTDVNSRNGTLLGGQLLVPGVAYLLGDGDRLHLGREALVELRVLIGASAGAAPSPAGEITNPGGSLRPVKPTHAQPPSPGTRAVPTKPDA